MKLEDLAALIDKSIGTLSELERGLVGYTPETLDRIAKALDVPVGKLFEPPDAPESETDVLGIWRAIPERDRPKALRVLRGFVEEG